jgi:hypothetical protein
VLLYEGQPHFDIIFRNPPSQGGGATVGVQEGNGGGGMRTASWSCNTGGLQSGHKVTFDRRTCSGSFRP